MLALLITPALQAQTIIKGGIVAGEWTKAGSRYSIEDHMKVPKDSLLKIMGNGDYLHPNTGKLLGNLFDYVY